jgi:GT2 family glycosyltransferase
MNSPTPRPNGLRIAVGIATAGRGQIARELLHTLQSQTRPADTIVVSAPSADDVREIRSDCGVRLMLGHHGLTTQRNAIIRAIVDHDAVVFFDDDFLPNASYLDAVARIFCTYPDIALVTGEVIADGIIGPGYSVDDARRLLAADSPPSGSSRLLPVYNAYGCNMAVRLSSVREANILFDENLPSYGWLEDVDFSRRIATRGRIVKASDARGVHLGVKRGRQSGLRLGYSQIANPIYLMRKGNFAWRRGLALMARNVVSNCVRSMKPEPYVDRIGRAAGNARALVDLAIGNLHPTRIMAL